jgi:anti-sigma factor RsiW
MMSTDHDPLLSAYLDGQVDPDQKRRAEEVLAADPGALETLNRLAAVRDLVAGLARPHAPEDFTRGVLNRLAAQAARPRPWKSWGPYLGRGLGGSALAASVALIVFLGAESESRRRGRSDAPRVGPTPSLRVASATTPIPTPTPAVAAPSPGPAEDVKTVELGPLPAAVPPPVVAVAEPATPQRVEPPGLRELWETAGPRRDFVVTSKSDEPTTATVASLLGQSTHRDYFKIEVPADLKSAPPAETAVATAFAANLDPQEFATLRVRLESEFRERVALSESDPEVAGLLAEVGHATAASPTPAADVAFPRSALAIRSPYNPDASSPSPLDATAPPDASASAVIPNPVRSAVVVIWIIGPSPN